MSYEGQQLIEPVEDELMLTIIRHSIGSGAEISSSKLMTGGYFNTLYDIETANPADHLVLRIAPNPTPLLYTFERTMMLAEPFIYERIREAGVPTAEIICVDGSRKLIGRDYMVMRHIDAVQMNHQSVPEEVKPQLRRDMGKYTAQIHEIKGDKFGWIMPDGSIRGGGSWADVFGELMTETFTRASSAGVLAQDELDAALGCLRKNRAVFDECSEPVLVHNDIWDPNILVTENNGTWQIEAVIDADRAVYADREYEFILWDNPDPDLIAGYGIPLDTSENARIRRKFYCMQLYMNYAWFHLVMRPSPDFQEYSRNFSKGILKELLEPVTD